MNEIAVNELQLPFTTDDTIQMKNKALKIKFIYIGYRSQ